MKIENKLNQLTGFTKEQKNIGIIANIPAGFQKLSDNRHSPTVNKNGNKIRKDLIILYFICIHFAVYQILIP